MNKTELIEHLGREWRALLQSCEGLPEARASEPGVIGAWSVKDILGHITTWEEATISNLGLMMQGQPAQEYEDFETYNQEEVAHKAPLSFAEVQRQLDDTHSRLLAALDGVPQERWADDTHPGARTGGDLQPLPGALRAGPGVAKGEGGCEASGPSPGKEAAGWARGRNLRARWVEPRSNDAAAITFHLSVGFRLSGFIEGVRSNRDDRDGEGTL